MSGRRTNKQARVLKQLAQMEPVRAHLSTCQWSRSKGRIAEFIEDSTSVHADTRGAVARLNALPLLFDWTALMALRLDGQIVWVPTTTNPEKLRSFGKSG